MLSAAEQRMILGRLKFKKGQNPDNVATAIGALQVEYRNNISKEDKIVTLVSAVGPFCEEIIVNKMEKIKSAKGKEVTCDAIVGKL